jgi:hypothetical protein
MRTPIEESIDGDIARKIFGDGTSALPSLRLSLRATASHSKAGFESVDQAALAARVATALNVILGERSRFVGSGFRLKKRASRPNPATGRVETVHYGVGVPCSMEEAGLLSSRIQADGGLAIDLGDGQRGTLMVFLGDDPAEAHHLLQISADSWGPLADSPQAAEGLFDFLKANGGASMGVQWVARVQPGGADTWEILSSFATEGCLPPTLSSIPSGSLRAPASAVHFLALVSGGHEFTCRAQAGGVNISDKSPRTSGGSPRSVRIQIQRLFPTLSPRKRVEQPPATASRATPGSFAAVAALGQDPSSCPSAGGVAATPSSPPAPPAGEEDQVVKDVPTITTEAGLSDLAIAAAAPASMDERLSAGSDKRGRSPSPPPLDPAARPVNEEDLELEDGRARVKAAERAAKKATEKAAKAAQAASKAAEEAIKAAAEADAQAQAEAAAAAERAAAAAAAVERRQRAEEERQAKRRSDRAEKERQKKEEKRKAAAAKAQSQGRVTKSRGNSKKEKLSNIPEELEEEAQEAAGLMAGVERTLEGGSVREVTGTLPTDRHDGPQ